MSEQDRKERPGQLDVYLEGNTSWKEMEETIQRKKELGNEFRLIISKQVKMSEMKTEAIV